MKYNPLMIWLHEPFHRYHNPKVTSSFSEKFFFNARVLRNLTSSNFENFSLKTKTVILHIVMMSGNFLLHFEIRLESGAKFRTQRPTEVPISCRLKLNAYLNDLQKIKKLNKPALRLIKNQPIDLFFRNHRSVYKGMTQLKLLQTLDIITQKLMNHLSFGHWNL